MDVPLHGARRSAAPEQRCGSSPLAAARRGANRQSPGHGRDPLGVRLGQGGAARRYIAAAAASGTSSRRVGVRRGPATGIGVGEQCRGANQGEPPVHVRRVKVVAERAQRRGDAKNETLGRRGGETTLVSATARWTTLQTTADTTDTTTVTAAAAAAAEQGLGGDRGRAVAAAAVDVLDLNGVVVVWRNDQACPEHRPAGTECTAHAGDKVGTGAAIVTEWQRWRPRLRRSPIRCASSNDPRGCGGGAGAGSSSSRGGGGGGGGEHNVTGAARREKPRRYSWRRSPRRRGW
jgi:hypothetical protein